MSGSCRIVMTGGGSGGHIYPGIAVADWLCSAAGLHREEILWICSDDPRDREVLSSYGISCRQITAGKLRRYWSVKNLIDPLRCISGWAQALRLLRHHRPDCVFSKGGYVSVPVVQAARMLGIPVISHESDLLPGLATRLNQGASRRICIPFEAAASRYRVKSRLLVTGNPVGRTEPEQGEFLPVPVPDGAFCLLVHGGSLGSQRLNSLIWELLPRLPDDLRVVHILGKQETRRAPQRSNYYPVSYLEGGFSRLLKRSDLVISRAGAGTLWEQALMGKAMVLLPLGRDISRGEQEENARYFAREGAALCFFSHALDTQRVIRDILSLVSDPGSRRRMGAAAQALVHDRGAERIGRVLVPYVTDDADKTVR